MTPTPQHQLALVALITTLASAVAAAAPPTALLEKYRCTTCHAEREALAGPAWVDVAARYRGKAHAEATVAAGIRAGIASGGPWHMPPHPEISPAEAATLARYILQLKE